jgi:hypothetical protein
MKTIKAVLMVSLMCLTSCYDYSRSLTNGKEITSELLLESARPGRTYVVKLKNGIDFKVRVKTVDRDSLSGLFTMVYPRVRHSSEVERTISRQQILEVKGRKHLIVPTLFVIVVPLAVGFLILDNAAFSPFN